MPLTGCLSRVLFRRYSPLSLEVAEKNEQMYNVFLVLNVFGRVDPNFDGRLLVRFILYTVWQSSVEFRLLTSVCEA